MELKQHFEIRTCSAWKTEGLVPTVVFQCWKYFTWLQRLSIHQFIYSCISLWFYLFRNIYFTGLPQWLSGKESTCNAGATGDVGSIPGSGRSPGGRMATASSILAWRIPMDRGAWQARVHKVAKSQTLLKWLSTFIGTYCKWSTYILCNHMTWWAKEKWSSVYLGVQNERISTISQNKIQACKFQITIKKTFCQTEPPSNRINSSGLMFLFLFLLLEGSCVPDGHLLGNLSTDWSSIPRLPLCNISILWL